MNCATYIVKGFSLIVFPLFIQSYQLTCPEFPQWRIRGYGHCNNSWQYTCLFDTNENEFKENCEFGVRFLGPGYKFVISGMLDRRTCAVERFQPFRLQSNISSSCVTLKSQCKGEGQIVFRNGTPTHDRSCRCNYINSYAFVTKPKATCYCIPSEEDCSCYYKACPVDHYLTPEYQCVHINNLAGIFVCPEIQYEKKPKPVAPSKSILTTRSIPDVHHQTLKAAITTLLTIIVCVLLLGHVIFCSKYKTSQTNAKTNQHAECGDESKGSKEHEMVAKTETDLDNMKIDKLAKWGDESNRPREHKMIAEIENDLDTMKKDILSKLGDKSNRSEEHKMIAETENDLDNMKKDVCSYPVVHINVSTFVQTRSFKLLKKQIDEKDYVNAVGVSGSGKSVILYQIADAMYNIAGYEIVTANKPSDILNKDNKSRKQLFIFDDVCGKFTFDSTLADSWNLLSDKIRRILKETKTKLLFSCRSHISKEKKFQAISILAENICDIQSTEFSMTGKDQYQIATIYLTKNDLYILNEAGNFKTGKCIPLLCYLYSLIRTQKSDVLEFFSNAIQGLNDEIDLMSQNQACSTLFFFLVIYNNKLRKSFVNDNQFMLNEIGDGIVSNEEVINAIQRYHLFVQQNNEHLFVCHDMVFDVLISFVSQRRLKEVLKFASADILCERCHFSSICLSPEYGCIRIPFKMEEIYFERLLSDFKMLEKSFTSKNRQLKFTSYRKKFINFLLENLHIIPSIYKIDVSSLLISTFQGFSDVVNGLLIIFGTNIINMTDDVGRTALYVAAEFNDIPTGTVLLKEKCNLYISRNDECHVNESPLHIAAFKGNNEFIELLIKNDVKLDKINGIKMTALHISCTKEDVKSVKLLLENDADPNIPNAKNNSPLHTAADIGNTLIVELLINHKSNLRMRNEEGQSPLCVAASKGHSDIVKLLLQADPKIVYVNDTPMSPLYLAAREGFNETVKILLECDAKPNSCALLNKSPLCVASENGHVKIVEHLLKTNADPNICTHGGFTPLYVSSLKGHTNIVHLLLENSADPNISSSKNLSPLFEACQKGYSNIVEYLLEKDADIRFSDLNKRSPLYIASREGHLDIVKLLLHKKANINHATDVKRTPLFAATLEGHPKVVQYLLNNHADLNISTVDCLTPLIVASRDGHFEILKILQNYVKSSEYDMLYE